MQTTRYVISCVVFCPCDSCGYLPPNSPAHGGMPLFCRGVHERPTYVGCQLLRMPLQHELLPSTYCEPVGHFKGARITQKQAIVIGVVVLLTAERHTRTSHLINCECDRDVFIPSYHFKNISKEPTGMTSNNRHDRRRRAAVAS